MHTDAGYVNADPKELRSPEDSNMIYQGDMLAPGLVRLYTELWLMERGYKSDLAIPIIRAEFEKLLAEYLRHRREFAENDLAGLLDHERIGAGVADNGFVVSAIEADVAHAKRQKYGKMH